MSPSLAIGIYEFEEHQILSEQKVTAMDMEAPGTALILEDDELDAAVTQELLEKCCARKFTVKRARVLKEALGMLSRTEFEVALLDMNVPDSNGLNTVREVIKANPHVPIIVLTGNEDMNMAIEALRLGAQDYLPKSQLDNQTLQRMIQYAIQRKEKEADLTFKAYFDSLTGLVNRTLLYERWRRTLSRARRIGRKTGVLIADINAFKKVNDQFGHMAGDALLQDFSKKLGACVRETDIVARLGGDEFVIVLENIRYKEEVEHVRDTIVSQTSGGFKFDETYVEYSASLGGTISDPRDNEDLMAVIKRADAEMYRHKALASGAHNYGSSTIVQ